METKDVDISGEVKPGFEAVREAFAENFARRNELGAACAIYHRGEKVVMLPRRAANPIPAPAT